MHRQKRIVHDQQQEEDARVSLLVDEQLPARVQSEHLRVFLRHSWFQWCSAHDILLRPIVGETKSREWPHPRSVRQREPGRLDLAAGPCQ
jgi:hypothetical protein